VLDEEVIVRDARSIAWTIPLAFPVTAERAKELRPGQTVALVNEKNELVGDLAVTRRLRWDKAALRPLRLRHRAVLGPPPAGAWLEKDPSTHLVGGEVRVLPQPKHPEYGQFILSPPQTRTTFRDRG